MSAPTVSEQRAAALARIRQLETELIEADLDDPHRDDAHRRIARLREMLDTLPQEGTP